MSSLQLFRSVKEVLSANSEATEEHIEKQDKVLNSLGTYFILNVVIIFKKSMTFIGLSNILYSFGIRVNKI
jgi:hypothetical protein